MKIISAGSTSSLCVENLADSTYTLVDSAESGRNAALSFFWTLESLPKSGPATPAMPNQATMDKTAITVNLLGREAKRTPEGCRVRMVRIYQWSSRCHESAMHPCG